MDVLVRNHVASVAHLVEEVFHVRVGHRATAVVDQEVLLRHIGDVVDGLVVLGQQVIEGLFLGWPDLLGDRLPPFLGVAEYRVHVNNDAPERI